MGSLFRAWSSGGAQHGAAGVQRTQCGSAGQEKDGRIDGWMRDGRRWAVEMDVERMWARGGQTGRFGAEIRKQECLTGHEGVDD